MSLIHFKYLNEVDEGTIFRYSSQITTLPATNVQNAIKNKVWRTESGFVITEYNCQLPFRDTSTGAVKSYAIPSGTYTGSGLASIIASGLDSVGDYSNHTASYNTSTNIMQIGRSATATGIFSLVFNSTAERANSVAVITGFENATDYTGSNIYTSTSTQGNEHEIIASFTSTQSVNTVIIDNHNWATGTIIRLRGTAETATVFSGGWNTTADIGLSSTLTYNSSIISVEITATSIKHMQIYWYDRSQAYSEIGRLWAGTYFEPENHAENDITWRVKNLNERTRQVESEAGVTWFQRKTRVPIYSVGVDPLDIYYNSATKTGWENLIDNVGNHKAFYISFNVSLNANTVYGFFISNFEYARISKTPVLELGILDFKEQL